MSRELRVTMHVEWHDGRVEDRLGLSTSVPHQSAGDRRDWAWSTTGSSDVEDQSFDFAGSISCNQVHASATAANGPTSRSAVNASRRVVDGLRGITPTMLFQRTIESSLSNANTDGAHSNASITPNVFFIFGLVLYSRYPFWLVQAYRLLGQPTADQQRKQDLAVTISVQFW
jgi:hypothetical protein